MTRARYPGAQPFADEPLSRAVFFGREKESVALADMVLANRLVVVYAKSGVGKTSLLHAGIAQVLRDDGCLPLFVRLNDPKQPAVKAVYAGIADAARRQGVEYQHGDETSLWHFFKTLECWREDHLLTPVLVLDQFEELFTLHDPAARQPFLKDLGYLVRGARPPRPDGAAPPIDASLGDSPPPVRIVISLREDHLGALEEGADQIPQILNQRFRLTALTVEAAADALSGPAALDHEALDTRPFTFKPGTVDAILKHLSQGGRAAATRSHRYIEPFHLQLICQRVEAIAADRQKNEAGQVAVGLEELGGTKGLDITLGGFFKGVLASLDSRRTRSQVQRLCLNHLISPEGRRLSLEGDEIRRMLKLKEETLRALVDRRLLRADQRADSWYFELSHDSLVAPILASRKGRALALGGAGLLGSLALTLGAVAVAGTASVAGITALVDTVEDGLEYGIFVAFLVALAAVLLWRGVGGVRRSVTRLSRYRFRPR